MTTRSDELLELCTDTAAEYNERDQMFDDLESYYFLNDDKDDETQNVAEIERVVQPHGTNAVDLVMDLLAQAELNVSVPAPSEKKSDQKLADDCELYLGAAMAESERDQKVSLIGRAAWWAAMRGCLAGRVVPIESRIEKESDAPGAVWAVGSTLPLQIQMRDPRYVYPEFSADGLSYIVEKWDRKVRDIRDSYGPKVLPNRKDSEIVEWIEYWDKDEFCYWADGALVKTGGQRKKAGPWPHRLGGIPYAFEFARQTGKTDPELRVRPMLEGMRAVIDKMDLLDSQMMTFISRYIGDVLIVESDDMSQAGSDRSISTQSGDINYTKPGEKVDWLNAGRQPLEMGAMRGLLQTTFERGTFPGTLYGEDPGRVMAGYAINMLNQSGQARMHSIVECLERVMASLLSNVLMVSERWLVPYIGASKIAFYTYGDIEEETGDTRKVRESHELDAAKLDGYYHVEVQLGDLLAADEQANIVLAEKARAPDANGRPLLSDETIYNKYKLVKQATVERERIDRQMAWNDPEVQALNQKLWQAKVLAELKDELAELDVDALQVLSEMKAAQQAQQQQQAPGMPGMGQPQMDPAMMAAMQQQMMMQQGMQQPGMAPPGVMPPQMQGQMMPQPGMAVEEEPGMMPPMMPGMGPGV